MIYNIKAEWPEGVTMGVGTITGGVQYTYSNEGGHGGGGYGAGELTDENFIAACKGGPGMAFLCCINAVTSIKNSKIRMRRSSSVYESRNFIKPQWQGDDATQEWSFNSVSNDDSPATFGTGFTVKTHLSNKSTRSYSLSPLKIYDNTKDGTYIEFGNVDDPGIVSPLASGLSHISTAVYSKSNVNDPLKLFGSQYTNTIYSILHSVTCNELVTPGGRKEIYIKGFDKTKESTTPAPAVCYIMLQGCGGGGGGADSKWGIFAGHAAGGGGGGGGAALLLRFKPKPGVNYKIVLETGYGGDPGSSGSEGSAGMPGDSTYAYIYNADTDKKLVTAFAPGGWGGGGGKGDSGGSGGSESASPMLMIPDDEIKDNIEVVLGVKGTSGSYGSNGGASGNFYPQRDEDNTLTTTHYNFDVGTVDVYCNVFGHRGSINNPNGDVGGAGGGSWWSVGGYCWSSK